MTPERIHERLQAIADDITVGQRYAMEEHDSEAEQMRTLEALIARVDGIADAATGLHVSLKEHRRQMPKGEVDQCMVCDEYTANGVDNGNGTVCHVCAGG